MIIGMLLMIMGGVLVTRNREIALLIGREPHTQWGFMTSVARQNIAIMGTIFLLGGLAFFVLF